MDRQKLHEAKEIFDRAGAYGSDNYAVNLLAKGLSLLVDALLDVQKHKREQPTGELEQD